MRNQIKDSGSRDEIYEKSLGYNWTEYKTNTNCLSHGKNICTVYKLN